MIEHAEHFILNTGLPTFENRLINHFRFGFLMKLADANGDIDGNFREAAYDNLEYLLDNIVTEEPLILYNLMWMKYAEESVDILTPEKIVELGVKAIRRFKIKQMGRNYVDDYWQMYLAVFCELEDYLRFNSKIEVHKGYRHTREYPLFLYSVNRAIADAKKKYNGKRK